MKRIGLAIHWHLDKYIGKLRRVTSKKPCFWVTRPNDCSLSVKKPFSGSIYIFLIFSFLICAISCATTPSNSTEREGKQLIQASHHPAPSWISSPLEPDGSYYYFVGVSQEMVASESIARAQALEVCREQAGQYISSTVEIIDERHGTAVGRSSDAFNPEIVSKTSRETRSLNVVSSIKPTSLYTEQWKKRENVGWKVFMLCTAPISVLDSPGK